MATQSTAEHVPNHRGESVADLVTESVTIRRLFGLSVFVGFIGWLDTALLTGIHLAVLPLPEGVDVTGTGWEVLVSDWSYLLGVPTAMYGSLYYLTVITLAIAWLALRLPQIERIFLPVTGVGVLMSGVFVYLQLFVIGAICPFCMISAATTATLFLLGMAIYRTSEAPSIAELGLAGMDSRTIIWPVAMLAVGVTFLAMLHLVTVLPLPVPGA